MAAWGFINPAISFSGTTSIARSTRRHRPDYLHLVVTYADVPVVEVAGRVAMSGEEFQPFVDAEKASLVLDTPCSSKTGPGSLGTGEVVNLTPFLQGCKVHVGEHAVPNIAPARLTARASPAGRLPVHSIVDDAGCRA